MLVVPVEQYLGKSYFFLLGCGAKGRPRARTATTPTTTE